MLCCADSLRIGWWLVISRSPSRDTLRIGWWLEISVDGDVGGVDQCADGGGWWRRGGHRQGRRRAAAAGLLRLDEVGLRAETWTLVGQVHERLDELLDAGVSEVLLHAPLLDLRFVEQARRAEVEGALDVVHRVAPHDPVHGAAPEQRARARAHADIAALGRCADGGS